MTITTKLTLAVFFATDTNASLVVFLIQEDTGHKKPAEFQLHVGQCFSPGHPGCSQQPPLNQNTSGNCICMVPMEDGGV